MASTLTVGTNTYATRAQADTYHEDHHGSAAWDGASDDAKDRALLSATRLLEQHVEWGGAPESTAQALAWPRTGLCTRNGEAVADYPVELQHATAEFARMLIEDATRTNDSALETGRIGLDAPGGAGIRWDGTGRAKVVPDSVWYLLPAAWVLSIRQRAKPGAELEWVAG